MIASNQGWPATALREVPLTAADRDQDASLRPPPSEMGVEHVRSVFLSDTHLGNRHAQIEPLLTFLDRLRPDRIYLVGDIVDGWELRRGSAWPEAASRFLRRLIALTEDGAELFYTPGNHDAFLRTGGELRALIERLTCAQIQDEFIAQMADGRRLLVTHGDLFDFFETSAQWMSKLLGIVYQGCLSANWWLSRSRSQTSQSPYRLCAVVKQWVKQFVRFISRYESSLVNHARHRDCDGVICGHLHTPALVERDGMLYGNTGDWMENCTAIVERFDGALELHRFYEYAEPLVVPPADDRRTLSRRPNERNSFRGANDARTGPTGNVLIPSP
jgi:UDP-2,3-diacylglucosamine pyrophosphatase LpxH